MPKTKNFAEVIRRKLADDPKLAKEVATARLHAEVAQVIYDARTAAGLTQSELAKKIGSHQSAIARLEDADYGGHTLTMLRKIAEALGKGVEVRFVDATK